MKLAIEERKALGNALAAKRCTQNLTQEKLAALAGVPIRTLQRAERGDGIGQENLDSIAMALHTDSAGLLSIATTTKGGSPDLRLKLEEISTPIKFVRHLRRPHSVLQIGPEGEHSFNEHVGQFIFNLMELTGQEAIREANYILQFCARMGFGLFIPISPS